MTAIFRFFEAFAQPFERFDPGRPPRHGIAFIWHYVRQIRGPFLIMLFLGGCQALVEAALFVFVGVIVDLMAAGPRETFIVDNLTVLLAMAATVLFARFAVWVANSILEEQIVVPGFFTMVRWQAHRAVGRQDVAFFDDEMSGRISQKVWQSGQAAGDFMISLLQIMWFIAIFAFTTLILIARLDFVMMLPVLAWLALVSVIAFVFVPRIRLRGRETAEAASVVTGRMVDGYTNIRMIKLYGAESSQDSYVRLGWDKLLRTLQHFTRAVAGMRIASQGLSSVMLVTIGTLAVHLYQSGALSAGEVAVVFALCLRLNLLMNRLLGLLNGLFRNLGTVQNSAELIAKRPAITDAPNAAEMQSVNGEVKFDGVTFAYNKGADVIEDFMLNIPAGQKLGIVGQSGVGKSTLMNLLLRFNDIDAGSLTIDGQSITDVTQASLRRQFGLVSQDTSLLHRSIRDNIAFGKPDATQAQIEDAARRAKAHDFILALRDSRGRTGYDTLVGERGVKLSGGQRQRIAIARVFLRDAPVLLLDEATSALDSEVEAAIQEHLVELMKGKTVIAIAHRLSTISHLERLIVMENGRIIEDGDHTKLLAANGLYARLWERQTGGYLKQEDLEFHRI